MAKIGAIRGQTDDQVKALLTSEQAKTYEIRNAVDDVFAQREKRRQEEEKKRSEENNQRYFDLQMKDLAEPLGLTGSRQAELRKILTHQQQLLEEWAKDHEEERNKDRKIGDGPYWQAYRAKMKELNASRDNQIKKLLTPEQQKIYEEIPSIGFGR